MPEKGKTFAGEVREETVAWSKDTYQLLKQAEQGKVKSYVQDIALAVLDCKETATSRETFIRLMNERGYGVDWQDSHKYITYTDLAREQAGEKACKIRDNKLEKYYNMDFGKESMEHEFERNARTAEAEQSKRAASRVKPTEPDRAGKQSAQRSVGDVERELRGIDEAVKSRTSKGRAEQAERRRAEQEAQSASVKQSVELLKNSNELLQDAISDEVGSLKDEVKENTVQEVRKALQANIEAIQRATKLLEKQSDTLTSVMKQKIRELEESKNSFFRYEGLKLYLFWGGMVCNILVFLMLAYSLFGK